MLTRVTVGLDERLLVESGVNTYRLFGPGRVWLTIGQRAITKIYVGPNALPFTFTEILTAEQVPVDVDLRLVYQIDPALITPELRPKLVKLQAGGWQSTLTWQAEHVLRQLLSDYTWQDLNRRNIRARLERQFSKTLVDLLAVVAIKVYEVKLLKIALPPALQRSVVQAEQDKIETGGRVAVLKAYAEHFGQHLPQAMPYIVQWELLNVLTKLDNPNLILSAANLSMRSGRPEQENGQVYQMSLPIIDGREPLKLQN